MWVLRLSAILLLAVATASHAAWLPTPELVVSSSVNPQSYTGGPRPLTCMARAVGIYWDPDQEINVDLPPPTDLPGCEVRVLAGGYNQWPAVSSAYMRDDPWTLTTSNRNTATSASTERNAFVNTTSGAGRWFVLHGPAGSVSLRIDIALQGRLTTYADGNQSGSAFLTHVVTAIASPTAELRERVTVVNRGIPPGVDACAYGTVGTIPDECYPNDGYSHDTSLVVRSNPFVVEVGVPFYIGVTNGAAAGVTPPASGYGYAASEHESCLATSSRLPAVAGLTPEGFVLDADGDPATHDFVAPTSAGYSVTSGTAPDLVAMSPSTTGESGPVTATIRGRAFGPTATAKLVAPGEADIDGVVEAVDVSGRWVRARFELDEAALGARELVVVNDPLRAADTTSTLAGAITNEAPKPPEVRVDSISPTLVELWGDFYLEVRLTNLGNIDANGTLVIDGIPKRSDWSVLNPASYWTESVTAARSSLGQALLFPPIVVPPKSPVNFRVRIGENGLGEKLDLKLVWEE
jgi:hypothetical protein